MRPAKELTEGERAAVEALEEAKTKAKRKVSIIENEIRRIKGEPTPR